MLSICQWTGEHLRSVTKFVCKLRSCEARAHRLVSPVGTGKVAQQKLEILKKIATTFL